MEVGGNGAVRALAAAAAAGTACAAAIEGLRASTLAGLEFGAAPPELAPTALGAGLAAALACAATPRSARPWGTLLIAVAAGCAAGALLWLMPGEPLSRRRAALIACAVAASAALWALAARRRGTRALHAAALAVLLTGGWSVIRALQPLVPLVLRTADARAERPGAVPGARSIVLITIDTARRDAFGCYGGPKGATPRIDRFAEGAVRYLDAIATAPHTHPSMASILTGTLPTEHRSISGDPFLAEDVTTLAEHAWASGYDTAGFLDNPWLYGGYGLDRGYAHLESRAELWSIERWLEGRGERPFLLHVHLFHPHGPYELRDDGAAALGIDTGRPAARRVGPWVSAGDIRRGEDPDAHGFGPDEIRWLHDLYATEVWAADAFVGELLEILRRRRLLEGAVIALTADHGEEFGERGGLHHSHTLHAELVDAPLLVRAPGLEPGERPGVFSLAGVAPLLAELAGLGPMEESRSVAAGLALSFRFRKDGAHLVSARTDDLCLQLTWSGASAGPGAELFDRRADPLEGTDLAAERPADVQALSDRPQAAQALRALRRTPLEADPGRREEPPMARRALDALGYTGQSQARR